MGVGAGCGAPGTPMARFNGLGLNLGTLSRLSEAALEQPGKSKLNPDQNDALARQYIEDSAKRNDRAHGKAARKHV